MANATSPGVPLSTSPDGQTPPNGEDARPSTNPDGSRAGPVRRVYSGAGEERKDLDSFESVVRFRVFAWSLVGAFLGFLLGVFLRVQNGGGGWVIVATTAVGWAGSFVLPFLLLRGAGSAGSTLYAPSGRSTPRKREFSLAESYSARGEYDTAVSTFEAAISEDPTDPEPYLRVARLYRDRVKDPAASASWFKRALSEPTMSAGVRSRTRRELVEVYISRLGEPARAMPLLARIADESPDSPDGIWAAAELARIRSRVHGPGDEQ